VEASHYVCRPVSSLPNCHSSASLAPFRGHLEYCLIVCWRSALGGPLLLIQTGWSKSLPRNPSSSKIFISHFFSELRFYPTVLWQTFVAY
jgi:hypothetical protein